MTRELGALSIAAQPVLGITHPLVISRKNTGIPRGRSLVRSARAERAEKGQEG
jgi:hypothetical protein